MLNSIYSLTNDAIIALILRCVVSATVLALIVARYVLRVRLSPASGNVVWDASRAVISLTALVPALSLAEARIGLRGAEVTLQREASVLVLVDHEIAWAGDPGSSKPRAQLAAYARAILSDEWPRLSEGQRNARVDDLYAALSRAVEAIKPTTPQQQSMYSELLQHLDELSNLREARIAAASTRLPQAFWHWIRALTLITIVLAGATPWTAHNLLSMVLVTSALAALIALVVIMDVPFRGEGAVEPTGLQRVMSDIDR